MAWTETHAATPPRAGWRCSRRTPPTARIGSSDRGQRSVAWLRQTEYAGREHREGVVPLAVRFDVLAGDERRAGAAFAVDRAGRVVGVGREQLIGLLRRYSASSGGHEHDRARARLIATDGDATRHSAVVHA